MAGVREGGFGLQPAGLGDAGATGQPCARPGGGDGSSGSSSTRRLEVRKGEPDLSGNEEGPHGCRGCRRQGSPGTNLNTVV